MKLHLQEVSRLRMIEVCMGNWTWNPSLHGIRFYRFLIRLGDRIYFLLCIGLFSINMDRSSTCEIIRLITNKSELLGRSEVE